MPAALAAAAPVVADDCAAARFFGELKHLDGVGRAVRNALLQKRSPDDFDYFDFLYGYSLP